MDTNQFYPTPSALAHKAASLFQSLDIRCLLEPSAGNGDLLVGVKEHIGRWNLDRIHLCEINIQKHPLLREKGKVVGTDFLDMKGLEIYSHILMNPPFRVGVQHLLHAWKGMYFGEIVCILNAESIKNPYTEDRQRVVRLIEEHGSVDFVQSAFEEPDTLRRTSVEVALVWLKKDAGVSRFSTEFLDALHRDRSPEAGDMPDIQLGALALPGKVIENLVTSFDLAWKAEKEAYLAEVRAGYFTRGFAKQFEALFQDEESSVHFHTRKPPATLEERWTDLKKAAWSAVLTLTNTEKYLTTKVVQRIRSEFDNISQLEFSVGNIYGFLQGLAENQGNLHIDMVLDLFDRITQTGENTLFYKSWKSNAKHRVGMKIRSKRFILGGFSLGGWRRSLSWEAEQGLRDIDRAFAVLDGKERPDVAVSDLFANGNDTWDQLRSGKRLSSSYFDVRYYKGIGTIHFYPKDQRIIDKLNTLVGRHRQWIPEQPDEAFQEQYDQAEAITDRLWRNRKAAEAIPYMVYRDESRMSSHQQDTVSDAVDGVLDDLGLNFSRSLPPSAVLSIGQLSIL